MNNGEENGGPVYIGLCPTARTPRDSNLYWNVVNGGFSADGRGPLTEIKFFGGTKCLDVVDGSTANGALLQLWECTGGPNQKFHVNNNDFTISWDGQNKCVDLPGGNTAAGLRVSCFFDRYACLRADLELGPIVGLRFDQPKPEVGFRFPSLHRQAHRSVRHRYEF